MSKLVNLKHDEFLNNSQINLAKFDIKTLEKYFQTKSESYWQNIAKKNAFNLFQVTANKVPAYKDFLHKHKIEPSKIKSIEDFFKIPITTKENYIQQYPISDRCLNGNLDKIKIIASSSGTSGNPNYWPRSTEQEFEAEKIHEILFKHLYHIDKHKTLIIIGFPMGVYVSGVATLLPSWNVIKKYNATILSAGNNKLEVLKAVKNLSKNFEQTLLIGHPFFIKDILETGSQEGIKWKQINLKMMFCSEGFSEQWREYILKISGIKAASAYSTYGCSEMLLMAYETPISVRLRKTLSRNSELSNKVLHSHDTPNIFQYNPALRYIEQINNELIFTSNSGIPLIRFNLHDTGTILPFSKVNELMKTEKELTKNAWKLPFVSVSGRSDYAIIFYAANIYPSHIHQVLNQEIFLKNITGKFTMVKGYYKNMDEYLKIHVELNSNTKPDRNLAKKIQNEMVKKLKIINSEFNFIWHNLNKNVEPQVELWPLAHEKYFKTGLKPKYIL